jgi:hypothetical protein
VHPAIFSLLSINLISAFNTISMLLCCVDIDICIMLFKGEDMSMSLGRKMGVVEVEADLNGERSISLGRSCT